MKVPCLHQRAVCNHPHLPPTAAVTSYPGLDPNFSKGHSLFLKRLPMLSGIRQKQVAVLPTVFVYRLSAPDPRLSPAEQLWCGGAMMMALRPPGARSVLASCRVRWWGVTQTGDRGVCVCGGGHGGMLRRCRRLDLFCLLDYTYVIVATLSERKC